jgi:hypothetical protein
MWYFRGWTKTGFLVLFVIRIVSFKPKDFAVAFEREYVRRNTIEKPAIVRDDHCAAGEVFKRFFKRS